eukprot:CAMPEP_0170489814 /NCGR_PEP_ID=MMETSP0208-20121228/8119_1 /TAXON_ID=197538 /ORGANISM="Strombidium inclinatum, Strain S3" /LENGTH=106 /DNA_ID=CAMNT_0010764917 /DNA_START=36 /DNA_END=353 /DNA_ORIENTATION=+
MSEKMSDVSMSHGSLNLRAKTNVPKKWDNSKLKDHFAKKFAENPEKRWKLEMKLDEIAEEVNDDKLDDLDPKTWKMKYYLKIGPDEHVSIFEETNSENYREYLEMI